MIEISSVFVSYLSTLFSTSKLTSFNKSSIPVTTDHTVIKFSAINVFNTLFRTLSIVHYNKTKSAWSLLDSVESHYNLSNFSCPFEEVVDLKFGCEEAEITNV